MVRPWADYISHGPQARAWIRIAAETSARPERVWHEYVDHAPRGIVETGASLLGQLEGSLGPRLALDRMTRVNLAALHLCADRARQAGGSELVLLAHEDWVDDLVVTSAAALLAPAHRRSNRPVGPEPRAHLGGDRRASSIAGVSMWASKRTTLPSRTVRRCTSWTSKAAPVAFAVPAVRPICTTVSPAA